MSDIVLKVKNLTKRFPGVTALDNVNFELRYGEIHGLLGENGAGKSTLVKILYGIYTPDSGEIYIDGRKVVITSPIDALEHGLALVSQNPQLIDKLTIA
ncbi:MAG: ABC transporter, partial [Desulfurococcales archaeon ex4484_42]